MTFVSPLIGRTLDDGRTVRLEKDLLYRRPLDGSLIVVPKGFETNFASTPWFLWAIFPPRGRWSKAAVLHDWLYAQKRISRFKADCIFRDAMRELNVPLWRRMTMYYAVRLFGKPYKTR